MKFIVSSIFLSSIALNANSANGFAFIGPKSCRTESMSLNMGLFDGVKDAFAAPALERSTINSERETPIDRWMGWNVNKNEEEVVESVPGSKAPSNFVDSMDAVNYISAEIEKPMGLVFEENDEDFGGIFLLSLKEGCNGQLSGLLQPGDQLVSVQGKKVTGLKFDEALSTIVDSENSHVKLTLFRGTADMFYGPTGASKEWLDEFISTQ